MFYVSYVSCFSCFLFLIFPKPYGRSSLSYPLIPPCATAVIMYLRAKKNSIIIGITTTKAAAISRSYRIPAACTKEVRPTVTVRIFGSFVTSIGHKKEFQLSILFSKIIVIIAGLAMGTIILHKYFRLLAPSTRAA